MRTAEDIERVASYMVTYNTHPRTHTAQTRFRMGLVEGWGIPAGAKVLEIGCGQGDMTVVLADAVGTNGHVTAVDIGPRHYGEPVTVGDATDHVKTTPVGPRIDFHFEYDVLDSAHDFPANTFDYVVLAHCSWYFTSLDQLRSILTRVRPWAKSLCYSEWDMEPKSMDQIGHLLAILIQGQMETFDQSDRNIRTPFSRATLTRIVAESSWQIAAETTVDASDLQDAGWEINDCLGFCVAEIDASPNLPTKARELLHSELDVLRSVAASGHRRPLPSYSVLATNGA